ncbi:ER membrane protein DP1/Yop1, partial [Massospora cicadina]
MSFSEKQVAKIKHYRDICDKELSHYPIFVRLEALTGINKVYLVGSAIGVFTLMVIINCAGGLLSSLLGWIYPAYASFKALETANKDDDTQWLTYWCVYGFLHILEHFSDYLLHWIPFYYLAKSIFLVWLFHNYFRCLCNLLAKAAPIIDSYIGRAKMLLP